MVDREYSTNNYESSQISIRAVMKNPDFLAAHKSTNV